MLLLPQQLTTPLPLSLSLARAQFENSGPLQQMYSPVAMFSDTPTLDYTLRFFSVCPAYLEYLNSPVSSSESVKFSSSQAMQDVAARMSDFVGVDGFALSTEEVRYGWRFLFFLRVCSALLCAFTRPNRSILLQSLTAFLFCAYEIAALNITDQFCSLINATDVDTLNYVDDLATYWQMVSCSA